ncbi:MAG: hypothetical protein JEZ06_23085 [Anaerolineaceae bacterium]|nr:hypothetical protein [Anaerolineaceae bacterium]
MNILHWVSFHSRDNIEHILKERNIDYSTSKLFNSKYSIHLEISENDENWPLINELIKKNKGRDLFDTKFDSNEIQSSPWNRMIIDYQNRYPYPKDLDKLGEYLYKNYCDECGIGVNQINPYTIKKDIQPKNHNFMRLTDAYEIFVSTNIISDLEHNNIEGYSILPLLLIKDEEPSLTASQLHIENTLDPSFIPDGDLACQLCSKCGNKKYHYHRRGKMRFMKHNFPEKIDIVLSNEWFGAGGRQAYREVLVSQKLTNLILNQKWKQVIFKPLQLI